MSFVADCLTLNVWRPANATGNSSLPVIVYIHVGVSTFSLIKPDLTLSFLQGGGNYYNSAQGFPMPDWVTTSNGGVVAVSIQYRVRPRTSTFFLDPPTSDTPCHPCFSSVFSGTSPRPILRSTRPSTQTSDSSTSGLPSSGSRRTSRLLEETPRR